MSRKSLLALLVTACLGAALAAGAAPRPTQGVPGTRPGLKGPRKETPEQFAARTKWWREAKLGMFIHWGIYAVPADSTDLKGNRGIGEWYFSNKQMQVADYERFASGM